MESSVAPVSDTQLSNDVYPAISDALCPTFPTITNPILQSIIMEPVRRTPPDTIKRKSYSLDFKVNVINEIMGGKRTAEVGRRFKLPHSTVCSIWKEREKILNAHDQNSPSMKRVRRPGREDIDLALLRWFKQMQSLNITVSNYNLMLKAEEIAEALGGQKFKCTNGWLSRFKGRHNIRLRKTNEEAASKKTPQNEDDDDDFMDQDVTTKLEVKFTTPEDECRPGQDIVYSTSTVKEEPVSDADEDGVLSQISKPSTSGVTFSVAGLSNDGASDTLSKASTSQAAPDAWKNPAAPSAILGLPPPGDSSESAAKSAASPAKNSQTDLTCPSDETQSLNSMSVVSASDFSEPKQTSDRPRDQFDVYGEYIASKLRKLDWKSCAYVQKAFSDIIFEAEMGKYKDAS